MTDDISDELILKYEFLHDLMDDYENVMNKKMYDFYTGKEITIDVSDDNPEEYLKRIMFKKKNIIYNGEMIQYVE